MQEQNDQLGYLVNHRTSKIHALAEGLVIRKEGREFCRFIKSEGKLCVKSLNRDFRILHNGLHLQYNVVLPLNDGDFLQVNKTLYKVDLFEKELPGTIPQTSLEGTQLRNSFIAICATMLMVLGSVFHFYQVDKKEPNTDLIITHLPVMSRYFEDVSGISKKYQKILGRVDQGLIGVKEAEVTLRNDLIPTIEELHKTLKEHTPKGSYSMKRKQQILYVIQGLHTHVSYMIEYFDTGHRLYYDKATQLGKIHGPYFEKLVASFKLEYDRFPEKAPQNQTQRVPASED